MLILSKVEIANNIWDSELLISYLKFILKILSPFKCYFGIKILLNNKMFPKRFKGIFFRVLYGFRLLLWIFLLGAFLFSFFNLNDKFPKSIFFFFIFTFHKYYLDIVSNNVYFYPNSYLFFFNSLTDL